MEMSLAYANELCASHTSLINAVFDNFEVKKIPKRLACRWSKHKGRQELFLEF